MKRYEMMVTVRPERIISARKARGLSQAEAARAAGISAACLCFLEKGTKDKTTNTTAAAIAKALQADPATLFEGYAEPKSQAGAGCALSAAEKSRLAEKHLEWVRVIAWENCGYFQFDFEEAFSFSLVCFAETLNQYDGAGNIRTKIARTIKNRAISELRKQTAAKRSATLVHLDQYISNESKTDYYNFIPCSYCMEDEIILRDEVRRAVAGLSPERRRERKIEALLECVNL